MILVKVPELRIRTSLTHFLGMQWAEKFGENPEVVNAIGRTMMR